MASIGESSKMAERWKLVKRGVADNFIVSRVYNCKWNCRSPDHQLAITINRMERQNVLGISTGIFGVRRRHFHCLVEPAPKEKNAKIFASAG
jgi:hypothetical protein